MKRHCFTVLHGLSKHAFSPGCFNNDCSWFWKSMVCAGLVLIYFHHEYDASGSRSVLSFTASQVAAPRRMRAKSTRRTFSTYFLWPRDICTSAFWGGSPWVHKHKHSHASFPGPSCCFPLSPDPRADPSLFLHHFRIMMLSVLRHTKTPVKFWFLKNYLSPSFKVLPLSFCYSCLEKNGSFRALFRLSKGMIWGLFPFCNILSVLWPFYACNIMSGTHKRTSIIFVLLGWIV